MICFFRVAGEGASFVPVVFQMSARMVLPNIFETKPGNSPVMPVHAGALPGFVSAAGHTAFDSHRNPGKAEKIHGNERKRLIFLEKNAFSTRSACFFQKNLDI